jgi:hypothetical protein
VLLTSHQIFYRKAMQAITQDEVRNIRAFGRARF